MRLRSVVLAVVALLVGQIGSLQAGEPAPAGPLPAGAIAVLRPADNPLAKPGGRVPVPTIVWEKVEVRPDHPRMFFNKETKKAFLARLDQHPMRAAFEQAAKNGDPLANALLYQVTGRPNYAQWAIQQLLAGDAGNFAPYVFDWTYEVMTEEQRRDAIERLWAMATVDRASGWPRCSPYTAFPDDPRPSETPPAQWPRFYNWTFHDQDWARRDAITFEVLIALAGHRPRAAEGVRNIWEYSLKDATLFLDHLRDGAYWQGYYWSVTERVREIIRMFALMKSACGIDYLDPKDHPCLANVGRWLLYCSDPARGRMIYNYGDGEMVTFADRNPAQTRFYSALICSGDLSKDPYVEWLARRAAPDQRDWFLELFHHDPLLEAVGPTALTPARAYPGTGLAVMRSGWEGHQAWACVRFCDWLDMHVHPDVASFMVYCKSPLVPDTGFYCPGIYHASGYYTRTVAHNTITVRDPAATVPLNDGCQRTREKRIWSWAVGTDAWLYNQTEGERGDLVAFETHALYDYSAGDASKAYRPEVLREFTRQTVFLRPGVLLIFDRAETPRPELEKRWLMHLVGEPKVDGKLLRAEVKGHIEDYDGALVVSQGAEQAVLRCHALLPTARRIRKIGGSIGDIPVNSLVPVPRTTHRMATGSRWEWTDPLILYYNDPLTGKKLGAMCVERETPTDAEYEVTNSEIYLKLNAYERGRIDEFRLKFADYKTLLDLVRDIGDRLEWEWHSAIHYLPGYEYYNEGINYAPAYRNWQWRDPAKYAPELINLPNNFGGWRVEVYPTQPATRDYFLHVLRVLSNPGDEEGTVTLERNTDDLAEAKIVLAGNTYLLSFPKKGPMGGHIRITDAAGKVLADTDFAKSIVQKD